MQRIGGPDRRSRQGVELLDVTLDFHGPMKHPQDVYLLVVLEEVGDTVMAVKENSNLPIGMDLIAVSYPWKLGQDLGPVINALDDICGRERIVVSDILVNLA